MNGKITQIASTKPQPVPEIIEELRETLKMAESGELRGLSMARVFDDDSCSSTFVGYCCDSLFLEFDRLKMHYLLNDEDTPDG